MHSVVTQYGNRLNRGCQVVKGLARFWAKNRDSSQKSTYSKNILNFVANYQKLGTVSENKVFKKLKLTGKK